MQQRCSGKAAFILSDCSPWTSSFKNRKIENTREGHVTAHEKTPSLQNAHTRHPHLLFANLDQRIKSIESWRKNPWKNKKKAKERENLLERSSPNQHAHNCFGHCKELIHSLSRSPKSDGPVHWEPCSASRNVRKKRLYPSESWWHLVLIKSEKQKLASKRHSGKTCDQFVILVSIWSIMARNGNQKFPTAGAKNTDPLALVTIHNPNQMSWKRQWQRASPWGRAETFTCKMPAVLEHLARLFYWCRKFAQKKLHSICQTVLLGHPRSKTRKKTHGKGMLLLMKKPLPFKMHLPAAHYCFSQTLINE